MYKRICSVLLSSVLAFGVSTKQSDASLVGGTLRIIGGTIFWSTAAICNIVPISGLFFLNDEYKGWAALGCWFTANITGLPGYGSGGIFYMIGRLCDLDVNKGDNKKYDDAEEKRRQAEEKRRQEEHEILMAKYRKELGELGEKKRNIKSRSKI